MAPALKRGAYDFFTILQMAYHGCLKNPFYFGKPFSNSAIRNSHQNPKNLRQIALAARRPCHPHFSPENLLYSVPLPVLQSGTGKGTTGGGSKFVNFPFTPKPWDLHLRFPLPFLTIRAHSRYFILTSKTRIRLRGRRICGCFLQGGKAIRWPSPRYSPARVLRARSCCCSSHMWR